MQFIFFLPSLIILFLFIAAFFYESLEFFKFAGLGLFSMSILFTNFFTKYTIIGECMLTDEEIIIAVNDQITKFPLSGMQDLKIEYWGYDGKQFGKRVSPSSNDGTMNNIRFTYQGQSSEIYLLLQEVHVAPLNYLFQIWQNKGVAFTLTNLFGKKKDMVD